MKRMYSRFLVGAAVAVLIAVDPTASVAQTTFQACRIPNVGAIYIINVAGAPAACLDASHIAFSWTEGGAPADGSVTTPKLADGAVTSLKIADGTVAAADHAVGSVNSAAVVDGTLVAADHAAGSVTTTQILDGTVAAADLAAGVVIPAGVEFAKDLLNFDPTTTATTAASLTLSYPASGYIVAHALGQVNCSLDTSVLLGISNGTTAVDGWTNYPGSIGNYTFVHKQDVIAVTGAGTATVNFNVQLSGSDNCTYFRALNVDAIYVPVRY